MEGMDEGSTNAIDQQSSLGALRTGFDLQDDRGAGWPGREGDQRSTIRPQLLTPRSGVFRFHCWNKSGHGSLDLHQALKYSCDVYFYQVALRTGIDRVSAMAHRLGMGTELDIDLPGQRVGLCPTKDWRISKGHPWQLGDTVVSGIGQGYIVVSPLQLAIVRRAWIATGRSITAPFYRAASRVPCNRAPAA